MINTNKIIIREAQLEDCRDIWEWWNDPVTRKMMKKNDYVEWSEHCLWFKKLLLDDTRILCLGIANSHKIGNVRFDLQPNEEDIYEVSINLNPLFRGKGYGALLLKGCIVYFKKVRRVKKLFATLKNTNIPSQRTFEKAEFIFEMDPKYNYKGLEDFLCETELYCQRMFY